MPAKSHGDTGTRLYNTWLNMKARCYRKSAREYDNYGGRGISVCDEWKNSYEKFKEWAISNGYKDNLTIDRIDVNGNYEPDNCRWITNQEQQNNRRDNVFLEIDGRKQTLSQWSRELGIPYDVLRKRMLSKKSEKDIKEKVKKSSLIDMTGKKYNRLTVLSLVSTKGGARWKCKCDCGNFTIQDGYNIRKGVVVSCGCLNREKASERYKNVVKARVNKSDNRIIRCYTKDGEFIKEYLGVKSASKDVGISREMIWRAIRNWNYTAKGMKWRCIE